MSHAAASSSKRRGLASRLVVAAIALTGFTALAWADVVGVGGMPPMSWLLPVVVAAAGGCGLEAVRLAATRGLRLDGRVTAEAPMMSGWIDCMWRVAAARSAGWSKWAHCDGGGNGGFVFVFVFAFLTVRLSLLALRLAEEDRGGM